MTLPPGMTAKLAGLRYCPEAAIAAAAANSGVAEAASPSCPADSLVGSASITSGSGPEPLRIDSGKAFLAGPYNGRSPLAGSDHPRHGRAVRSRHGRGQGGAVRRPEDRPGDSRHRPDPARLRRRPARRPLGLGQDRPPGLLAQRDQLHPLGRSPAPCAAAAPTRPTRPRSARSPPPRPTRRPAATRSASGRSSTCGRSAATKRAKNPKLRAILVARPGDANISPRRGHPAEGDHPRPGRRSRKVCTRVQFAANACPSNSIYGFAEANSPLLDGPLKGPVYLRSSTTRCRTSSPPCTARSTSSSPGAPTASTGRIRNTFDTVPDVPVTRIRADDQGRQEKRPAGQLAQPLQPQAVREDRPDRAERQAVWSRKS